MVKSKRALSACLATLLSKCVDPEIDEDLMALKDPKSIVAHIESCRTLRLWSREVAGKL